MTNVFESKAEKIADLPKETQAKLASVTSKLEVEQAKDPFAQVALNRLRAITERSELVSTIRSLQNQPEFPKLAEDLRTELSGLQTDVESTTETASRVTADTANAAIEQLNQTHPALKWTIIGGSVLLGGYIIGKAVDFVRWIGRGLVSGVKTSGSRVLWAGKWALGLLGIAAVGKVGYDVYNSQAPTAPSAKKES